MNLYDISIPTMTRLLGQVSVWLDKAQAYAEQKKFDPEVLLTARLAPDQWALGRQIQTITLSPLRMSAFLRGTTPPTYDEGAPTFATLRERLAASIAELKKLSPADFEGAESRVVALPFMPGKGMKGADFFVEFVLPNFYFHATTAYAILRHNGVDVGKMDFLGALSLCDA